jgi:hypothetical protein
MNLSHLAEHCDYEGLPLHLPLQFAREGHLEPIECVTDSISGDQVCFVSPELLQPGERVDVDVRLPANKLGSNAFEIHLMCLVHVERVDTIQLTSGFRIGCRIREYRIRFGNTNFAAANDRTTRFRLPVWRC